MPKPDPEKAALRTAYAAFSGCPFGHGWTKVRACGAYMKALMEAEAEGLLDDDEWLDSLAEIREFLETA